MHWNPRACHFESFAGTAATELASVPFTITWQPTGSTIPVSGTQTALTALRQHGIPVDSSCEAGTCGTCILRLLKGAADHQDAVLSPDEHKELFTPCVSRAASEEPLILAPRAWGAQS
jgi:phthalate 4,5-dioxygenase reductase subunit